MPNHRPPSQLALPQELASAIAVHGEQTYPDECCGVLLGCDGEGQRVIERLLPIDNQWDAGERRRRFLITPEDMLRAEREARRQGLNILGFYHSHPDAPARPSEFDREHAWPWYTYLIASVRDGKFDDMTGWQLRDDRAGYDTVGVRDGG
ncbi:MAG: M67 family metallopeptidase [Thermomicrobiales bacterium]